MLRERIEQGEWSDSELLPAEKELADEYGVSRPTIRQSLQALTAEGLLTASRGRGRQVRHYHRLEWWPARFEHRDYRRDGSPDTSRDAWMLDIDAQGRIADQQVTPTMCRASARIAEQLQISPGETVLCRARTRTIDSKLWQTADSYYPMWIVEGDGAILLQPGDVVVPGGFMSYLGHAQRWFDDRMIGRMPTSSEVKRLDLDAGTPVIEHMRTGYDIEDKPVRVVVTVAPGDRHIIRHRVEAQ